MRMRNPERYQKDDARANNPSIVALRGLNFPLAKVSYHLVCLRCLLLLDVTSDRDTLTHIHRSYSVAGRVRSIAIDAF